MTAAIDFYFDFVSPYSYLANTILPGIAKSHAASINYRPFTLLELMVVIVIIGVLAALIAPSVLRHVGEAKITAAQSDINTLMRRFSPPRVRPSSFSRRRETTSLSR